MSFRSDQNSWMTDSERLFEDMVRGEAKRLCLARCRAASCMDSGQCGSGSQGPLKLFLDEARDRVNADIAGTA